MDCSCSSCSSIAKTCHIVYCITKFSICIDMLTRETKSICIYIHKSVLITIAVTIFRCYRYIRMDFDPQKDYYTILGVAEDASKDEIKKAFRTAAVKHHPDRGGDAEKFKAMNEAYQVLRDEKKKQQYDAYRK